ncbi:MAG TPA: transposase [Polyangia bacterium]|jgi:transposase
MDRYIGLDAHKQTCLLAVLDAKGKRVGAPRVVETNGEALVAAVQSIPGRRHLCLEEGTHSAWLHELLGPQVDEIVVTVPEKRRRGSKSDAADAEALAEALRVGAVRTRVFKAPPQFAALRDAVRGYGTAVRDVTRTKNRLRSLFRARGVPVGPEVYGPERMALAAQLPPSSRRLAEVWGAQLDALAQVRGTAEAWLEEEAKRHAIIGRLATVPGLGPIRSAQIVAITVTPHRFRTRRQFWSYSGLAIVTRSSAEWQQLDGRPVRVREPQTRGLNRNRHPLLKAVFKGAAKTIINQLPEHPLHQAYQRLVTSGTKDTLARLTLARKVASITLALWKRDERYDPAHHAGRQSG